MYTNKDNVKRVFYTNYRINPETGRPIKVNGPTFHRLVREYSVSQTISRDHHDFVEGTVLTGVEDVDKEIIFLLDFPSIVSFYGVRKSSSLLITSILPKIIHHFNPNNEDNIMYNLAFDIVEAGNLQLLLSFLELFKRAHWKYAHLMYVKRCMEFLHQYKCSNSIPDKTYKLTVESIKETIKFMKEGPQLPRITN